MLRKTLVACINNAEWLSMLAACLFAVFAQSQEPPLPISPTIAELTFVDGSKMRMTVLQESFELATKFGKLTVPAAEIKKITLGAHTTKAVEDDVAQCLKDFGDNDFKVRDVAKKKLIRHGLAAYFPIQRATKSEDLEVVQRATEVINKFKDDGAALPTQEDDIVQTDSFVVNGNLVARSIKCQSPFFGALDVQIKDLRTLTTPSGNTDVKVNANNADWQKSGIRCYAGRPLHISASGEIDLWPQTPGTYMSGPKGYTQVGKGGNFMAGALIVKLNANGTMFALGERYDTVPSADGEIYFQVIGSPWNNPSMGIYRVSVLQD